MKTKLKLHFFLLLMLLSVPASARAQGSAIGYQGRLNENGLPAIGLYDFTFAVFAAEAGGAALAGTVPLNAVPVTNGLFNVSLEFGSGLFTGAARWLEITVRASGVGVPKVLTPRTALLPTPYTIFAGSAGNVASGAVTANQLNTGGVLPTPGQFLSYNNGNLMWTAPAVASGNIWSALNGNAYYNAGSVGIGTTTPAHRLSISSGPSWTTHGWVGAVALPQASAIGWAANSAGQRFGMGHTDTGFYLFRTASNPGTTASPPIYDFAVNDVGSVGIGTTTPTAGYRLEVSGATLLRPANGTVQFGTPNGEIGMSITPTAGNRADLRFDGSILKLLAGPGVGPPSSVNGIAVHTSGNVSIGSLEPPLAKLQIVAQDALSLVGYQPFLTLADANAGYARSRIQGVNGEIVLEPESFVNGSNPNASVVIANSGNVSLRTLTIRGGADVAEPFELTTADITKGSVVVIDDEQAGKLKLSTRAYDTQVAGIVSGANGIDPGISLYQQGALEGGQNVALSGRVYVLADASSGAIKPGDLLTTSGTPGHAMKVSDHARSQGAILGKAMSALKEGKGTVLVLVTLQ
jgi:hypothetical protein